MSAIVTVAIAVTALLFIDLGIRRKSWQSGEDDYVFRLVNKKWIKVEL